MGVPGDRAYNLNVEAQWGLVACGAEAITFALQMLQSPDPQVPRTEATRASRRP